MPYRWTEPNLPADGATAPVVQLRLWPHRSLPRGGFVGFFGGTAARAALPLLTVLGSPGLWCLLPFFLVTLGGLWFAIHAAPMLEAEFGVPVSLNITATIRAALRRYEGGLPHRPDPAWGRLLATV